jgi:hypothetical protein
MGFAWATKSSASPLFFFIELTNSFLFDFWIFGFFFFDLALFNKKKKFDKFFFFENYVIIMRTNPTTSRPGISTIEEKSVGRIDQIIGPVLDITFPQASCLIFIML